MAPGDYIIRSKVAEGFSSGERHLYNPNGENRLFPVSVKPGLSMAVRKLISGDIVSVIVLGL